MVSQTVVKVNIMRMKICESMGENKNRIRDD